MKKQMFKKVSIVLAAFLLLTAMPLSSLAEKGDDVSVPQIFSVEKASASDAVMEKATSSDAYEDGELLDGIISNDIVPAEEEEVPAAVPATEEIPVPAAEVPADISGTWTIDGITTYRFEEDGTGALVLPEHEYIFSHTVEDNKLTLEFENSKIDPAVFTITLEGDTLTLVKEEDAGAAEFVLEKTDD